MTGKPYPVHMARDDQPKYRQIADELRARMESGEYPPDSLLPSKAELMKRYRVALNTVNNALGELRCHGLIETVHGVGTYARTPPPDEPSPEYRAMMGRIDAIGEEVRQLRADVAALKRAGAK